MSAISETYNRADNILELVDILPNVSFTTSETNKNGKYVDWRLAKWRKT